MGSRQGFFLYASRGQVAIRPWDTLNEEICGTNTLSTEQTSSLMIALQRGDLNSNLGPYPLSIHSTWSNISSYITQTVLRRADVMPGVLIYPGDADDMISGPLVQESKLKGKGGGKRRGGDGIETMATAVKPYFPNLARVTRFSDLVSVEASLREEANSVNAMQEGDIDCSPAARTQRLMSLSLDKSPVLVKLVTQLFEGSWDDLLGELQLSFIIFIFLFSHPALEHWKLLVNTICLSEGVLVNQPLFASIFIKTLYAQLNFCPDDFFDNELSKENFLRPSLSALFSALNSEGVSADVNAHKRRLFTFVKKKFSLYGSENGDSVVGQLRGYMASPSQENSATGFGPIETERCTEGEAGGKQESQRSPYQQKSWEDSFKNNNSRSPSQIDCQSQSFVTSTDVDMLYNLVDEDMPTIVGDDELRALGFDNNTGRTNGFADARAGAMEEDDKPGGDSGADIHAYSSTSQGLEQRWESIHHALNSALPSFPSLSGTTTPGTLGYTPSLPMHIDMSSNHRSCPSSPIDADIRHLPPLSPVEVEAGLFSWRYPHLYDEMVSSEGKEDMVMTALRVLSEQEDSTDEYSGASMEEGEGVGKEEDRFAGVRRSGGAEADHKKITRKLLLHEALMFVEFEVQKQSKKQGT